MYKVNISIDDVSPHPLSSAKVVDRCYEVLDVFPEAKFTLFIPLSYWRTQGETATAQPLKISLYREFCDLLRKLPKNNFELGYHGLFHGIPFESNNDEFCNLSYDDAMKKFQIMFNIVKESELIFSSVFRPPAWRMSGEAIKAAKDFGIEYLSLSPEKYAQDTYAGAHAKHDNVFYFNVNPPHKPLKIFERTEIVYHACEWDKNYLNKEKTEELVEFLQKHENEVDFCFIDEVV